MQLAQQNPQWAMMQSGMMPMYNMPMPMSMQGMQSGQNMSRSQAAEPDQSGNPYAPRDGGGRDRH